MMFESLFPHGALHYLAGGLLIGAGVSVLFVATGLIGGMSSFYSAVWSWISSREFFRQEKFTRTRQWRVVYALGLILGSFIWLMSSHSAPMTTSVPWWQLLAGGFVAGLGARLSGGCTSGHGICGMASLQLPSVLAVCTFLATAMITAHLVRALGGA